jgi:hypothetical protein
MRDKKGGRNGSREDDNSGDDDGTSSAHSGASGCRRNSGKGRCFNCGIRGDETSSVRSGASGCRRSSGKGRCFNCGIRGHFSEECPKSRRRHCTTTPMKNRRSCSAGRAVM